MIRTRQGCGIEINEIFNANFCKFFVYLCGLPFVTFVLRILEKL
jgi:hypothetical protein